ncbi:rho GTPase-activating protein 26 [Galendromus occidentalis]|uniref:Rho GTPase-activating protein 26 n=1 Tax=Galendromus occidentalis TaxID=34638 RepID=A0AAJ6QMW1_9ACAR|nr:rho GTPase-activating protein 26 [Galendromus occidentalis]
MVLLPLEFRDCLTDSPQFRENLACHEKELETTAQSMKSILKEIKELLNAAKNLSRAQRNLAKAFSEFKFETIGTSQTDDEIVISNSLKEFSRLLNTVEDERDRMLENAHTLIEPIETFRKERIGEAKEKKKRFEKDTAKYCSALEKSLGQSSKKSELKETDLEVVTAQANFFRTSLEYILHLQRVQEGKKTEFVETILRFMYGWLTFYHQGHEVANDFTPFNTDLQKKLQKTRESLEITNTKAELLMRKMLTEKPDPGSLNRMYTREGYLYLLEKKHLGSVWTKHFCQYRKEDRKFTMIPYSQNGNQKLTNCETIHLAECVRRMSETIDRRYCFDVTPRDKSPGTVFTFQALNAEDYKLWLAAMDGKDPRPPPLAPGMASQNANILINEEGLCFVKLCIDAIEKRGLEDQGLYRTAGVASKVQKLLQLAFDQKQVSQVNLMDANEWEVKTIASSLKNYLRHLPEPLMTFRLHQEFIKAAKLENAQERINRVEKLVQELPQENYRMLRILIEHLVKVSDNKTTNLMSISNLGVCFGPTLLRPEEETVAAIMDIKFCNVIVEILIENFSVIFSKPAVSPAVSNNSGGASGNIYEGSRQEVSRAAPPAAHQSPQVSTMNAISAQTGSPHRCSLRTPQTSISDLQMPTIYYPQGSPGGGSPQHIQQMQEGIYGYDALRSYTAVPVGVNAAMSVAAVNGVPQSAAPQAPSRHQYVSHACSYPLASQWSRDSAQGTGGGQTYHGSPNVPNYSATSQPTLTSSHGSVGSVSASPSGTGPSPGAVKAPSGCRVRTLYACVGENEQELSFEPNQIITDVRPSRETGWLEGVLNGKRGLIPENYIQYLNN